MMIVLTAGIVRTALSQVGDLSAALSAKMLNLADDEVLAEDVLNDMASVGVPYAAVAAALVPILGLIVENNTQARPGSQTPMPSSGGRGSLPGGRIPEEEIGLDDGA